MPPDAFSSGKMHKHALPRTPLRKLTALPRPFRSALLNERGEEPAYKGMEVKGKEEEKGMTLYYQRKPTKT